MDRDTILMWFIYLILGIIALWIIAMIFMNLDKIVGTILLYGIGLAIFWGACVAGGKMIENGISELAAICIALVIIILGIALMMFIVPESILDRVFGGM